MSVGVAFLGLFLAALGGYGAFIFGHRLDCAQENQRTEAVRTLSEIVRALQEDQRSLRHEVAGFEDQNANEPLPPIAAGPPTAAPATVQSAPSAPLVSLASTPPPALSSLLLPHPLEPASQPTPPDTSVSGTDAKLGFSAIEPPKLQLPTKAAAIAASRRGEERLISLDKRAGLIRNLRSHPGQEIEIRVAARSARAVKLAIELKTVFREAGWSVGEVEMITRQMPDETLMLSTGTFPPTKHFVGVYGALAAAGFLVTSDLVPDQAPHSVALFVGPMQ